MATASTMPLDEPIERLRYLSVQIVPYLQTPCTSQMPATEAKEEVVASILRFVKKEQSDVEGLLSVLGTAHRCGLTRKEFEDILMSERTSSSSIPLVTGPAIGTPSFKVLKPSSSQSFREMTDLEPNAIILDGSGSDETGLVGPKGLGHIKKTEAGRGREIKTELAQVSQRSGSKQVSWGRNEVHEIANRRELNEYLIEQERADKKISVLSLLRETCERSMDPPHFTSASIQFLAYAQAELASRYAYNTIKSNFNILKDIGVNVEIIQNIFSDAWEVMNGLKSFDTITVVYSPALRTTGTLLTRLTTLIQEELQFLQSAPPISPKLAAYLVDRVNNEDDKEAEHILNIAEYAGCPSNDIANLFFNAYNALRPKTI